VSDGNIWTSTDTGVTWVELTNSGRRNWRGIASSSDGTKLTAFVTKGFIYTGLFI
jgi:hypothetical protein